MDVPTTGHDPVLLAEVIDALRPEAGQLLVDCTLGRGGHALALAERVSPGGTVLGLDVDPHNLAYARQRLAGLGARVFHANFSELAAVLDLAAVGRAPDGILADLGISTNQLFEASYGLSFTNDVPLDMRLDPRSDLTAERIVNSWPEQKLADALYQLADERFSRRIARKIVQTRRQSPIRTTAHLADLVRGVLPPPRPMYKQNRRDKSPPIDPATRTFLALRMLVNRELENLHTLLGDAIARLRVGGRLAVISFHSTEDRVVKQAFASLELTQKIRKISKKPIIPSAAEVAVNPRSRSAKLRVVEKLSADAKFVR